MYLFFIKGIVQGVGFRPYIFRKAKREGLVGSVKNVGDGVEIIIDDSHFMDKLTDLPPLARVDSYEKRSIQIQPPKDFLIIKSTSSTGSTLLPPDIFTCPDCLSELNDPSNRRHDYYFITCTNCGPRYSMITDYPYDRPYTSMNKFKMCSQCSKEYSDPLNRRYHAQTIACPDCGPRLKLIKCAQNPDTSAEGELNDQSQEHDSQNKHADREIIKQVAGIIKKGQIVAIKGVGGFHICSTIEREAVKKIRQLLGRANKPFAVMVKDVKMARKFAEISQFEELNLNSPARPIVVLKKKQTISDNFDGEYVLGHISELDTIGVMLPYTPLHFMLFDHMDEPIIMTSCNMPGAPVKISTENLLKQELVGWILTHERKIINRVDDSVIKIISDKMVYLRRSRGYVPVPIKLPKPVRPTLALGAELNNVICTANDNHCFLSQHIGNCANIDTMDFLKDTAKKMIRLTRVDPEIIISDLHPGYETTTFAKELSDQLGAKHIQVQHHKAHIAGVAAEHGLTEYTGIAMDGLGYGDDGKIWGGEIFDFANGKFQRIGHLQYHQQFGDSAAVFPERMLISILSTFLTIDQIKRLGISTTDLKTILKAIESRFNCIETSSTGRVLDAAASLLGICRERTYEGRPAMLLETLAGTSRPYELRPNIIQKDNISIFDTTQLFKYLVQNITKDKSRLGATVLTYIAEGMYEIAKETGKPIVFSGGVAYNSIISEFMRQKGVLFNQEIPPGDGGLCYGQVSMANL
ncbi:carbamoyltransferase HypF [Candidatus Woesearchaeota archaeon]|nr:carbamoyltransferase HypF [Candidatus Woesearchaeota archaeon]